MSKHTPRKKSLGVSRPKKSGSPSASSSPKKAERPATGSRATPQANLVEGLMELYIRAGFEWFQKHKGCASSFEEYRIRGHVPEQIQMLREALRKGLPALGIGAKPTKEAVPALRRTVAKRSGAKPGRGSAKATPKPH